MLTGGGVLRIRGGVLRIRGGVLRIRGGVWRTIYNEHPDWNRTLDTIEEL